ncbi:hypothetical protein HOE31_02710 [bacterium]|jgi:hypothetical protein|nr:hypothetical protein [bacterium]MBT4121837.1 hypothetical protein [bacterium]MBT4335263.1 hypothetical protein [bacterium]MBT4495961.1 hypothetical protein [bacterium]MBT4763521.1 hypothetical protein [bacterium]
MEILIGAVLIKQNVNNYYMVLPWKKILMGIILLLIVISLSYLLYIFFFKSEITTTPTTFIPSDTVLEPGQLPEVVTRPTDQVSPDDTSFQGLVPSKVARGGLTEVQKNTFSSSKGAMTSSQGLVFYDSSSGKFLKVLSNGQLAEYSDKVFHQVESITWDRNGSQAILEYPDGANILYDFQEKKQITLPKEMREFTFSNDGNQIAAEVIGPNKENNWIVTANSNGSNIRFIEQIGDRASDVNVDFSPNNQVVATFRDSYDANRQEIIFIGQNQENFKSFVPEGRGFEGVWTPNGTRMFYSVYSANTSFKPQLWIVDAQGNNIGLNNTDLRLNTWAHKCTINGSGGSAYCAVPRDLPTGSGWYPELANEVPDDFYLINLETGSYSLLAVPDSDTGYQAQNVMLSSDESTLYFTNSDNNVYSIDLP